MCTSATVLMDLSAQLGSGLSRLATTALFKLIEAGDEVFILADRG
jgi:hypothetical protein